MGNIKHSTSSIDKASYAKYVCLSLQRMTIEKYDGKYRAKVELIYQKKKEEKKMVCVFLSQSLARSTAHAMPEICV